MASALPGLAETKVASRPHSASAQRQRAERLVPISYSVSRGRAMMIGAASGCLTESYTFSRGSAESRERSSQSEAFCGRFVQFLKRFGFFYLCNGCSITGFLPLQRCGAWRRSIYATRTPLCYPITKDKNSQNISKIEQKSSVLTRTLSAFCAGPIGGAATSKTTPSLCALCHLRRGVLLNESREHGAPARRLGPGPGLGLGSGSGSGLRLAPTPGMHRTVRTAAAPSFMLSDSSAGARAIAHARLNSPTGADEAVYCMPCAS